VNSALPSEINVIVRKPAALSRDSRSAPIAAPMATASTSRQKISHVIASHCGAGSHGEWGAEPARDRRTGLLVELADM
jgi:hypothetical protein